MEHLKTLTGAPTKNPQIWLTIYCNLTGLRDTFINHHHCRLESGLEFRGGRTRYRRGWQRGTTPLNRTTAPLNNRRVYGRLQQNRPVFFHRQRWISKEAADTHQENAESTQVGSYEVGSAWNDRSTIQALRSVPSN